jgi:hypothetical protein
MRAKVAVSKAQGRAHRVLRHGGKYVFTQWAKDDDLLRIVSSAIAEHGEQNIGLPAAPPPMRFSDECRRVLLASGFERVAVDRFNIEWKSARTEALLKLICGSALRGGDALKVCLMVRVIDPPRHMKMDRCGQSP